MDNLPFPFGENTFGLMLNVDWYQPYKYSPYSIGVIYLVVMNLPRFERYRRKNLILVGIIPGPNEPSLTINSYLSPLVDELNKLWEGVQMKLSNGEKIVRAALLCTGCDIPAGNKVCGFKGFGTSRGCNRCFKEFEGDGFTKSYAESLGQSVLTLSTANKLKRSERQTLSEHESSLSQSTVFGARPYLIYRIMMQYECLPLWIRYITYTWVQQNMF